MSNLLIRDLSPEAHQELKRRAERAGQSLQSYVAHVLETHVSHPTLADWLTELDDLQPVPDVTGTEAVSAARDELP